MCSGLISVAREPAGAHACVCVCVCVRACVRARVCVNKLRAIYYHLALCLVLAHRVVLLLNGAVRIKK